MAGLINWQEPAEDDEAGEHPANGSAGPGETSGTPAVLPPRGSTKATALLAAAVDRIQAHLTFYDQQGSSRPRGQKSWLNWATNRNQRGVAPDPGHAKMHEPGHAKTHEEQDEKLYVPFGQWTAIGYMTGWEESCRRMANEAATFGVLSALLASLTFPTFITPPDFTGNPETCLGIDPSTLEDMFGVTCFIAIVFAVADVCTAAITIMQIGACPTEADSMQFILTFQFIAAINFVLFFLAIISLSISGWSVLVYRYTLNVAISCTVFMFVCMIAVLGLCSRVYFGFTLRQLQAQHDMLLGVLQQRKAAGKGRAEIAPAAGGGKQPASTRAVVQLPKPVQE